MDSNNETKKIKTAKRLGILGIVLCGACCAIPLLPFIGAGAAASLAFWSEKIGLACLVGAAVFFMIYLIRKRNQKTACATDCECRDKATAA